MGTPAYQRVADSLREQIGSGQWAAGQQLPGELELVDTYGVSRNTIRQALNVLASVNLVRKQQGVGTFVSNQGLTHTLGDLRSFTKVMTDLGMAPGIRDIDIAPDPDPPKAALAFLPGSHLWRVSRVRMSEGRPFSVMQSWLPDDIGSSITVERLQEQQSLYEVMAELGIQLKEAEEKIRAEAAGEELARLLEVPLGSPLLTIHRWTTDRFGRAVEYVRSYSPGDRYEYFVKLTQ
ncbi:GntR family transcriptional regulator [Plantibacter sp. Mn2098]|uniref:GntR family transcriptional regulator n=1 Tax=Plantibacter sp. Mn2098 TaxID=3395266 RepID=UPI003BE60BBD